MPRKVSKPVTNIVELRSEICNALNELRSKKLSLNEAKEIKSLANTIVSTINIELKAHALSKTTPNIDFLKTN